MKIKLLKIELPVTEIAKLFADYICAIEPDEVDNECEFSQKFDITETIHVHDYCKPIELCFTGSFGGIYSDTTGIGEEPTSELTSRYMYDSSLNCYIDGEEIEINFGEIKDEIDKMVRV